MVIKTCTLKTHWKINAFFTKFNGKHAGKYAMLVNLKTTLSVVVFLVQFLIWKQRADRWQRKQEGNKLQPNSFIADLRPTMKE